MSSDEEPDDDEPLDPRIQAELEKLNKASMLINQLEVAVDDSRATWRQLLSESSFNLDALSKKLGGCVDKAKPYYDAFARALDAQVQVQKAAARFERAIGMQAAAREMVELAEQSHMNCSGRKQQTVSATSAMCLDTSALEVLNHATLKVMQAESDRLDCEVEHKRLSSAFKEEQERANALAKDLKKQIAKSKPYYDEVHRVQKSLEEQKSVVEKLERDVVAAKGMYNKALQRLEAISNDIHLKRQQASAAHKLGQRSQGVGSDTPPPPAEATAVRDPTASASAAMSRGAISPQRRSSKDMTDAATSGGYPELRIDGAESDKATCKEDPSPSTAINVSIGAAETAAFSQTAGSAFRSSSPSDSREEARAADEVGVHNSDSTLVCECAGVGTTVSLSYSAAVSSPLFADVTVSDGTPCSGNDEEENIVATDALVSAARDNFANLLLSSSLEDFHFQKAAGAAATDAMSADVFAGADVTAPSVSAEVAFPASKHVGLPRWASQSDHHRTETMASIAHRSVLFGHSFDSTYDQDLGRHQTQPLSVDRRGSTIKRTSFDQLPPPLAHLQQHYNHQQRASLSDPELSADLARIMAKLLSEDDASLV